MHVYTSGEPISGWGVGDLVTRTDSIIWRVIDQQQPVAMNIDSERGGFRSLLAIPIVSSGTLVASLNLRCRARGAYGPEHTALARLFADALAAPLTYLPLCAGLVNKAAHADVIAEIGRVISSSSEISEVYEQFASLVGNVIEFDRLSISSVEPGSDTLRVLHVGGLELAGRSQSGTRSLKGTLVDASIAVGKAVSILAAPLLLEGRPVGALLIARADPTGFSNNDLLLADRISAQIAGVVAAEIRRNELANEQARRHAAGAENLELVGAARAHSEFLTTVSHELSLL
jgi:GAF domain-containing protein